MCSWWDFEEIKAEAERICSNLSAVNFITSRKIGKFVMPYQLRANLNGSINLFSVWKRKQEVLIERKIFKFSPLCDRDFQRFFGFLFQKRTFENHQIIKHNRERNIALIEKLFHEQFFKSFPLNIFFARSIIKIYFHLIISLQHFSIHSEFEWNCNVAGEFIFVISKEPLECLFNNFFNFNLEWERSHNAESNCGERNFWKRGKTFPYAELLSTFFLYLTRYFRR